MVEKVQINLRAGADQKGRWETYVEESGRFATLSELIRASVEAEIQTDRTENEGLSPAIASDVQELQDELSAVRKHVAWLREHHQESVDISEFAQRLFQELEPLPEVDAPIQVPDEVEMDADSYQRQLRAQEVIEPQGTDQRVPQTASALANRLDSSPHRIEDAIGYLKDQFLPVTTVEYDDERHYFREA